MLSSILNGMEREKCGKSSARVSGVEKYKGKRIFKTNGGSKSRVDEQTNFVTIFCDEN